MDLKGIGGSIGNKIKINDQYNFFFYYDGKKFDYKNFQFLSVEDNIK